MLDVKKLKTRIKLEIILLWIESLQKKRTIYKKRKRSCFYNNRLYIGGGVKMKKILIALTLVLSFVGINKVSADTYDITHSDTAEYSCDFIVTDYDYLKELGYSDEVQELYRLSMQEYTDNYSSDYPYFFINLTVRSSENCNTISSFKEVKYIYLSLLMYSEVPEMDNWMFPFSSAYLFSSYDASSNVYELPTINGSTNSFVVDVNESFYNPFGFFISNFEFAYNGDHTFNITGNSNFTINPGDVIKPYYTVDNVFQINYTEINLNDYAYVALAYKDYTKNEFATTIQVKGQYCVTPVYGMGLETSEDILGNRVQNVCTPYYENYTPIRHYVLNQDLKNYAIYYIKAYDTSLDNYIKVDSSLFDITYITEENKYDPYVLVQGKYYPTIPYDSLPSTATQNTEEGYVPGESEEFSFSDIFTAPLEYLKDIWGSVVSFFVMIEKFFLLLPKPMQGFLLTSFTLAVSLGLIKIVL